MDLGALVLNLWRFVEVACVFVAFLSVANFMSLRSRKWWRWQPYFFLLMILLALVGYFVGHWPTTIIVAASGGLVGSLLVHLRLPSQG